MEIQRSIILPKFKELKSKEYKIDINLNKFLRKYDSEIIKLILDDDDYLIGAILDYDKINDEIIVRCINNISLLLNEYELIENKNEEMCKEIILLKDNLKYFEFLKERRIKILKGFINSDLYDENENNRIEHILELYKENKFSKLEYNSIEIDVTELLFTLCEDYIDDYENFLDMYEIWKDIIKMSSCKNFIFNIEEIVYRNILIILYDKIGILLDTNINKNTLDIFDTANENRDFEMIAQCKLIYMLSEELKDRITGEYKD